MKLLLPKVRIRGKTTLDKSNGRRPPPNRIKNRRALVSLGLAPRASRPFALFLKEQYAVEKKASRAEHQAEMKRVGAMWRNLDPESKATFRAKSQEQFNSQRQAVLKKVYPSSDHVAAAQKMEKFGNFSMLQHDDGCTSLAGEGSYGQVLLAWSNQRRLSAIKVFKTSDPEDLKHEALMYSRVKSATDCPSFFPELLAVEEKAKPFPHLAFAYCGLSLGHLLSSSGREPFQDAMTAAAQLRSALQLLHNVDIVHLDVKPANCFWSAELKQLKLGDFGMAISREPELSKAEQIARLRHPTYVTSWYRPPELWNADIKDLPHLLDWPVDVWSYSCVVHEMLTGKALFRPAQKFKVEELVAAWASNFSMLCTGLAGPSQRNGTAASRLFVRLIEVVGRQKNEMLKGLNLREARKWPAFHLVA